LEYQSRVSRRPVVLCLVYNSLLEYVVVLRGILKSMTGEGRVAESGLAWPLRMAYPYPILARRVVLHTVLKYVKCHLGHGCFMSLFCRHTHLGGRVLDLRNVAQVYALEIDSTL